MRTRAAILSLGLLASFAAQHALCCERESGDRAQRVFLSFNNQPLKDWIASSGHVETLDLPNGFRLGVEILPTSAEKYSMLFLSAQHVPELVQISLFDMSLTPPRKLTTTWGGSNSIQGYGSAGGADHIDELGTPGITLTLLRPVCAIESEVVKPADKVDK